MGLFSRKSALVKDPVCGMMVDPKKAAASIGHADHVHYFCSAGCKTKFEAGAGHQH